jgi:hypothetical protein
MTNSEFIEEILHEAHILGVASKVFEIARGLQSSGMDIPLAYDTAFRKILSEMEPARIL